MVMTLHSAPDDSRARLGSGDAAGRSAREPQYYRHEGWQHGINAGALPSWWSSTAAPFLPCSTAAPFLPCRTAPLCFLPFSFYDCKGGVLHLVPNGSGGDLCG